MIVGERHVNVLTGLLFFSLEKLMLCADTATFHKHIGIVSFDFMVTLTESLCC